MRPIILQMLVFAVLFLTTLRPTPSKRQAIDCYGTASLSIPGTDTCPVMSVPRIVGDGTEQLVTNAAIR
jgi:hypothetical protein